MARPKWAMPAVTAMLSGYRTLLEALLARGWPGSANRSACQLGAKRHCSSDEV